MAVSTAYAEPEDAPRRLFDEIGDFLDAQRLEADPTNYAFAYAVLSEPDSTLARAVTALTEGGVRLTRRDIESLGAKVTVSAAVAEERAERADGLVARTQLQVEGFADMVEDLRAETRVFGRDLAESADRMRQQADTLGDSTGVVDEVVRIAGAMADRVSDAEAQLARATREAEDLRSKLDEARDNARRDPLTNMPNRRAFEEAFAAGVEAGDAMLLAVCDVDHFKAVNDGFGHSVGDRVLKAIGGALVETCGDHHVSRYGGEEFVVLFRGIDSRKALETLDEARAAVAAKRYRVRETDKPLGSITFSAGLVSIEPGESDRTAFGRADKLLYVAKHDGRNCVRTDG